MCIGIWGLWQQQACHAHVYSLLLHLGSEDWAAWCQEDGNRDDDTVRIVQTIAEHPPVQPNTNCHLSLATLGSSSPSFSIKWESLPTLWDVTNCHVLPQPPFTGRKKLQMHSEKKNLLFPCKKNAVSVPKILSFYNGLKHTHTQMPLMTLSFGWHISGNSSF